MKAHLKKHWVRYAVALAAAGAAGYFGGPAAGLSILKLLAPELGAGLLSP